MNTVIEQSVKLQPRTLPDKPSELIRLALNDMRKCIDEGYAIDMQTWHSKDSDGVCHVCLAGSIMAQTLQLPIGTMSEGPECTELAKPIKNRLYALNEFRVGAVGRGLVRMGKTLPKRWTAVVKVCPHIFDRELFFIDMNRLADNLEKEGL